MRYMLLVHHSEELLDELPEDVRDGLLDESIRLAHTLHANGQYLDAAPLQPTSTAVHVRTRNGKSVVTDGPFAEAREQLGGYFLVEAENIEAAAAIAGRIPGARIGTVEVRPIREVTGLPVV